MFGVGFGVNACTVTVGQTRLATHRAFAIATCFTVGTFAIASTTVIAIALRVNTGFSTLGLTFWTFRATGHRKARDKSEHKQQDQPSPSHTSTLSSCGGLNGQ